MRLRVLQLRFNRSPRLLIRFDGGYMSSCGAQWLNRAERPAAKREQDSLPPPERANDFSGGILEITRGHRFHNRFWQLLR